MDDDDGSVGDNGSDLNGFDCSSSAEMIIGIMVVVVMVVMVEVVMMQLVMMMRVMVMFS